MSTGIAMHERGSPTKEAAKYVEEYDGDSSPAALDYGLASMSAEERRIKVGHNFSYSFT